MNKVIIRLLLCGVMVLSIISVSIIGATMPSHSTATSDEISTPDQSTIDEITTIVVTTQNTGATVTTKPTENITEKSTENTTEKPTEVIQEKVESVDDDIIECDTKKNEDTVNSIESNVDYLLSINNPDYNYVTRSYSLTEAERYNIACVVMGEFGGGGFTGCALIAQSIRDAMTEYGYSASSVISAMQYYGYNSSPNSDSYNAVDYIFSGNAAVQHRILYMNNSPGGWHGTQQYVLDHQGVWFYDKW